MLAPEEFRSVFVSAQPWPEYLASAKPSQRPGWDASYAAIALTERQRALVRSFERRINVLVISGTWCGDCVQQCPMLARIAETHPASPLGGPGIDLRYVDRDTHLPFAGRFQICGGHRVPTVLFFSEVFDFVSLLGDRTLSRYRALAARNLGPSCPLPGAPLDADERAATLQDWINELERVALLLRLSPKLRQIHRD